MGLRYASVRHPNVVVMAPALTETAQSQNFKSRTSRLPLALKKYKQKCSPVVSPERNLSSPETKTNGVKSFLGMNGHSPPKKITYSINGLAKTLKNEFLPLDRTESDSPKKTPEDPDKKPAKVKSETEDPDYSLTQIGGFIMNHSYPGTEENQSTMGLQKSNKDISTAEASKPAKEKFCTAEVDQLLKNLGAIMSNEDVTSSTDLSSQNVEEILQVITSLENNGGDMCPPEIGTLESGPSTENEGMFPISDGTDITGSLSTFCERDLFNVVDVMNMCVDESLMTVNKDAMIKERIEEARKKQFQLKRKCEFLMRRLHKIQARAVGKHVSEEITGVIEHATNLLENRKEDTQVKAPVSVAMMSVLMRQLDHASSQQSNSVISRSNSNKQCKYFGSGSSSGNGVLVMSNGLRPSSGSILPQFSKRVKQEMDQVAGELHSQLSLVQSEIDSDVTASSSGCESCDEFMPYNNHHQHQLTISKRAAWRWAEERAAVACRWSWLQAQMADLEYKIRQQSEIRRQIRSSKGQVRLEGEPIHDTPTNLSHQHNGYSGGDESELGGCSRTRGLVRTCYLKRKLLESGGLHLENKRAAKPTSLRCSCRAPLAPCLLCTGREDPTQPRDPLQSAPVSQRIALLDPAYHPLLSFPSDCSERQHYDAILKCGEWQLKAARLPGKSLSLQGQQLPLGSQGSGGGGGGGVVVGAGAAREAAQAAQDPSSSASTSTNLALTPVDVRRKHNSLVDKQTSPTIAMFNKLKRKIVRSRRRRKSGGLNFDRYRQRRKTNVITGDDNSRSGMSMEDGLYESSTGGDISRFSPVPSPTPSKDQFRRKRENSYDIDNIVIPYSIAASTRPEKLHYKEILTPKWRRVKEERIESLDHKNGVVRRSSHEIVEGEEDISEEAFLVRHERSEADEKKKFLSYLKLPNSGLGRNRGQKRTDSRAESSGPNTPDPMSPATRDGGGGGEENGISPMVSPPATPITICESEPTDKQAPARRRTISLSRLEPPKSPPPLDTYEVAPYEPRVFPLSDELYMKMLSENDTQPYSVINNTNYKHYESVERNRPGTPSSFSTDSAESYLMEDPNDPEWTISHSQVDRLPNKR